MSTHIVVNTSITVRFTEIMASKKKALTRISVTTPPSQYNMIYFYMKVKFKQEVFNMKFEIKTETLP